MGQPPVLTSPNLLSTLLQRFAYARLSQPCLPKSRLGFSATLTTRQGADKSRSAPGSSPWNETWKYWPSKSPTDTYVSFNFNGLPTIMRALGAALFARFGCLDRSHEITFSYTGRSLRGTQSAT